jgi:hypothetical protein
MGLVDQVSLEVCAYALALTFFAAFVSTVAAGLLGAALSFRATHSVGYALLLASLFVPFAVGSGVWAFSVARVSDWLGLQGWLLQQDTTTRSFALTFSLLARSIPLGVLFCATTLHPYTIEVRPYFRLHRILPTFYIAGATSQLPRSILVLVGVFSAAMFASDASLAFFLYRANPGTPPETLNLLLARLFKEYHPVVGPSLVQLLAVAGLLIGALLLAVALAGGLLGNSFVGVVRRWLNQTRSGFCVSAVVWVLQFAAATCAIPALVVLAVSANAASILTMGPTATLESLSQYLPIVCTGTIVAFVVVGIGLCSAVFLRYGMADRYNDLDHSMITLAAVFVPAFLPTITVIQPLGALASSSTAVEYVIMLIGHIFLHISIFLFICVTLISSIPERHVAWQRSVQMTYRFSLITDGFRRYRGALSGLFGMALVQIITDGVVSRWFSNLVKSPEETLYSAVFGRLSSANDAALVVVIVTTLGLVISFALGKAYLRGLSKQPAYD